MRLPVTLLLIGISSHVVAELPKEQPLWPDANARSDGLEIHYEEGETVREYAPAPGSPSKANRVFSRIARATYTLHVADPEGATGIGLVICPGGGYNDVWLDREGHDLALRLKGKGITSLVLKYRTNSEGEGGRPYRWKDYIPEVTADAQQALHTLRDRAEELSLDPDKIGICGFSAGGHLALSAALAEADPKHLPNFAGLLYPWLEGGPPTAKPRKGLPPMFLMNAADDSVTPPEKCIAYYTELVRAGTKAELHIYNKGNHGFDLATGRSEAGSLWPDSFAAWLRDLFPAK